MVSKRNKISCRHLEGAYEKNRREKLKRRTNIPWHLLYSGKKLQLGAPGLTPTGTGSRWTESRQLLPGRDHGNCSTIFVLGCVGGTSDTDSADQLGAAVPRKTTFPVSLQLVLSDFWGFEGAWVELGQL